MAQIAKVLSTGQFVVQSPKDGWVDGQGKEVKVSASPKATKFFDDIASAKANGFSPTELQSKLLAGK